MSGYDLPSRLAPGAPRLLIEALVGVGCLGLVVVVRLMLEVVAPHAAPFALAYPAALLSTMLAGWRAGLITVGFAGAGVWYLFLSPEMGFMPLSALDAIDFALNTLAALLVVLIAQLFRASPAGARTQHGLARDLMLRELNHRVKNNFQMVAGLLDMHRRAAPDPVTSQALESVIARVRSLGQAHGALYVPSGDVDVIDFSRYLDHLCRSLSDSLLLNTDVHLECAAESAPMAPERAAALGVVINELVTNAVKHAFPDGRAGAISVSFCRRGDGWRLTVADDGVGLDATAASGAGIGRRLVQAFVRQARGTLAEGAGPGASFIIDLVD